MSILTVPGDALLRWSPHPGHPDDEWLLHGSRSTAALPTAIQPYFCLTSDDVFCRDYLSLFSDYSSSENRLCPWSNWRAGVELAAHADRWL